MRLPLPNNGHLGNNLKPKKVFSSFIIFILKRTSGNKDHRFLPGLLSMAATMHALSVVFDSLWPAWTVACQVPRSMGFSRQEHWSGLPFPPWGDLPNQGIEPVSYISCTGWWVDSLPLHHLGIGWNSTSLCGTPEILLLRSFLTNSSKYTDNCFFPGHAETGAWSNSRQWDRNGQEGMGWGFRMGNTCKSMAESCQCMAKTTTIL